MKSKRIFILAIGIMLSGLLPGLALAKDEAVTSTWLSTAPTIDGQAGDWAGVARTLNKATQVEYAFRNDGENIYILFVFKDPKYLSSMNATGITLFFNPEGKKDKDRGIRFIRRNVNADQLISILEKQGQTLTEERKQELRARSQYILFDSGIVDDSGKVVAQAVGSGQSLPPVFRIGRDGKDLVYEFRLPLSGRKDHPAAIGTAPGRALKVGFEWGGMTAAMRQQRASQIGSEATQATESASSFDEEYLAMGNEDVGGKSASLASMMRGPKKQSFWVDLTLAASEAK